jgi:hypothetical protein
MVGRLPPLGVPTNSSGTRELLTTGRHHHRSPYGLARMVSMVLAHGERAKRAGQHVMISLCSCGHLYRYISSPYQWT